MHSRVAPGETRLDAGPVLADQTEWTARASACLGVEPGGTGLSQAPPGSFPNEHNRRTACGHLRSPRRPRLHASLHRSRGALTV